MSIRLLPSSGRVIGLSPGGSGESFLWTNSGPSGPWPNPGGDRTWLAPELELFLSDLDRVSETYRVPAALDPGHWEQAGPNRLVNATRLRLHRWIARVDAANEFRRGFQPRQRRTRCGKTRDGPDSSGVSAMRESAG